MMRIIVADVYTWKLAAHDPATGRRLIPRRILPFRMCSTHTTSPIYGTAVFVRMQVAFQVEERKKHSTARSMRAI